MKTTINLLIAIFYTCALSAQVFHSSGNTVIAPSGLKLRKSPNLSGEKLAVIPFGTSVEVLQEPMLMSEEVVDYIHDYHGRRQEMYGYWAKVRYSTPGKDTLEGYVFSPLLGNYFPEKGAPDFMLWRDAVTCRELTFNPQDYHWYGLYILPNGEQEVRAIQPTIYDCSEAVPQLYISTGQDSAAVMLIASKTALSTVRQARPLQRSYPIPLSDYQNHCFAYHEPLLSFSWQEENDPYGEHPVYLHYRYQHEIVKMRWFDERPIDDHEVGRLELIWYGDLNGDGYPDFLIDAADRRNNYLLYLGDELRVAKPFTRWIEGPCC